MRCNFAQSPTGVAARAAGALRFRETSESGSPPSGIGGTSSGMWKWLDMTQNHHRWQGSAEKAPPCDQPRFPAAQVFVLAAETGWPEERILHMPQARLARYQHCLLRRNGVRTQ
jgi:hypothetical protein